MALHVQNFHSYSALNLYCNLLLAGVHYLLTSRYAGIQHENDFFEPKIDTEVCSKVSTFVEKSVKQSICLDKIVPGSCVLHRGMDYEV